MIKLINTKSSLWVTYTFRIYFWNIYYYLLDDFKKKFDEEITQQLVGSYCELYNIEFIKEM